MDFLVRGTSLTDGLHCQMDFLVIYTFIEPFVNLATKDSFPFCRHTAFMSGRLTGHQKKMSLLARCPSMSGRRMSLPVSAPDTPESDEDLFAACCVQVGMTLY